MPCTACHVAHSLPLPDQTRPGSPFLLSPPPELCAGCHPAVARLAALPERHAPFAAGGCSACHDVHGTDRAALLIASPETLCPACHARVIEGVRSTAHAALALGDSACLTCHDPHASSFAPLLAAEEVLLCPRCHAGYTDQYSHPVGRPFIDPRTGDTLYCSACHELHLGEHPRLVRLTGDGLCLSCHSDIGVEF